MFKLYGNYAGWHKISEAMNERDIIGDMIDDSNKNNFYDYMIIKRENNADEMFLRLRNQDEFTSYLNLYKSRIKQLEDMSCIELKRYILEKKNLRK